MKIEQNISNVVTSVKRNASYITAASTAHQHLTRSAHAQSVWRTQNRLARVTLNITARSTYAQSVWRNQGLPAREILPIN
jgi:hypothetical protein